jgi:broad specificity phosphatase PhoE
MEILLVRHGKPEGAVNPVVDSPGFAKWVRRYNRLGLRPDSRPPAALMPSPGESFVISSDLPRARESAERCAGRAPDLVLPVLREMEIPRYRIPGRLRAYSWLYINRALWMLGRRGSFESFRKAKVRAHRAARRLHLLAGSHDKVVAFGHAYINKYVASELGALGWQIEGRTRPGYWACRRLRRLDDGSHERP